MTVIFREATKCCKNDIQRKITQRKHEVELQFLGTALPNITINKRTKFQVISPEDYDIMLETSKKCYKNDG